VTYQIIRVNLATGAETIVAVRGDIQAAVDITEALNRHAVGWAFRVEVGA
jgi:hypothetical protein